MGEKLKKKSKAIDKPENVKLQEEEKKEISNNHFKEAVYIKMAKKETDKEIIPGLQTKNIIQIIDTLMESAKALVYKKRTRPIEAIEDKAMP